MSIRIGIDTGGTFTDVVCYDTESGRIYTTKTPSTPGAFDHGVLNGLDKILEQGGYGGPDVVFLSHGTTVGTNAVLENEIPPLGLITNDGLRDVLEIGDQTRPELYDLYTDKPPTLVPRHRRKEVPGRIDSRGNEIEPLDVEAAEAVVSELVEEGVEAIIVSLLFSYLNDDHERQVGEVIERIAPEMEYALSSVVHPEIREYDRTITTVLNEGIRTTIAEYLSRLDDGVEARSIAVPLNIMHSGGGLFNTNEATNRAIRTVLSGPAAGAVATRDVSRDEGYGHAIGIDMGGTSADVTLVRDGELVRSTELEINDLPIKSPMIDIETVGAGGGSIAWIDEGGALRVGPKSAGADPGPICYGRGGDEPTVTDANLLLGRIDPSAFLDGDMALAADRTRDRFREVIASPLGLEDDLEEAALSVITVANASMARAIRRVTVERGTDPSAFALVAFGGAGPLQALAVADEMDIETVIIPPSPGVFSARGLLMADVRVTESHAYRNESIETAAVEDQFVRLESTIRERLERQGFESDEMVLERQLDARYVGQSYELTVTVPTGTFDEDALDRTIERFHGEHERLYGHAIADEPVEIVTVRTNGFVSTPTIEEVSRARTSVAPETRPVYFAEDGFCTTSVYDRRSLEPGAEITGPAIIEESGCTSLIPPGAVGRVNESGSIIVSL